ncbi:hypothetical protein HBA_0275 [Sodalis endosymbiont of Henestaris halophilus]|nr:hypothetical protein HBA_0275 [Sodalis endosymbiont of Henestaris halophilus]
MCCALYTIDYLLSFREESKIFKIKSHVATQLVFIINMNLWVKCYLCCVIVFFIYTSLEG